MQLPRSPLAVLGWIFIGLLTVQVFLAGVGLFGAGRMSLHVDFGFLLVLMPVFMFLAAAFGREGRRLVGLSALLAGLTVMQILLPGLKREVPFVAALHPVNALLLLWLTVTIARHASRASSDVTGPTSSGDQPESIPGPSRETAR